MCGRIVVYRPADVLAQLFDAREAPGLREAYQPSFNLAPTRTVVGLATTRDGVRLLHPYRWGLRGHIFNARAETVTTNRLFAPSLAARRLAVLADGFFEWQSGRGDRRQPWFFRRADGEPLALAGLWDREDGHLVCTVMTTSAGDDMGGIHDRMPAILDRGALAAWLQPGDPGHHRSDTLLRPAPGGTLVRHPVNPRVGDVRNDAPDLIEPFEPPAEPLRLFG